MIDLQKVRLIMMLLASKCVSKSQSVLGKYAAGVPYKPQFERTPGRMRGVVTTHPMAGVNSASTSSRITRY